jgi:hypothetical protein
MASPPPTPAAAAAPRPDEATSPLVALDASPEAKARLLRTLLSRTDDVYAVLELNGTCIYISPSVEGLLGWRPEEMIGACACTRRAARVALPRLAAAQLRCALAPHMLGLTCNFVICPCSPPGFAATYARFACSPRQVA